MCRVEVKVIKMLKLSWLGIGVSLAVLGLSACSSNDEAKQVTEEQKPVQQVATTTEAKVETQPVVESKVKEEAVEITEHNAVFHGRNVYLRGEMNDYGVNSSYQLRKIEEGKYCTLAPLRADWSPYRFKFADAKWTKGTNFGFAVPPAVLREGSALAKLNPESRFEELRYEPEQDGIYRFCIEFQDDVPYVSVTFMEKGKLTTMDEVIERLVSGSLGSQHAANY